MIRVNIETPEINIGKTTVGGGNWVANYWVVRLLDEVVRGLDKATPDSGYNVRKNLIERLSQL